MRISLIVAVLCGPVLAGSACMHKHVAAAPTAPASPATQPSPAAPVADATPPDDLLNAVLWMQGSVEHDLAYRQIYRAAQEKLQAALDDPAWDALPAGERTGSPAGLPPAVIVDVDETVLDNSPYEARLVRDGGEYKKPSWAAWCTEEAAQPLPGALEMARFAASKGITTYYVTNRASILGAATLSNLRKAGFPVPDDSVYMGAETPVPGCTVVIPDDKGCRRQLVGRTHRVLMQFGDQIGDFVDVAANTPAGRVKAMAPYASWIGERWWVLPNAAYGGWEPAVFGNDWKLSRDIRRKAKRDALRP